VGGPPGRHSSLTKGDSGPAERGSREKLEKLEKFNALLRAFIE
jgi:hypothetical protein